MIFAGVDIGATKVHAIVAEEGGRVVARVRKRIGQDRSFEAVTAHVADLVRACCVAAEVDPAALGAVGIGAPSPVLEDGTAVNAPNLGWQHVPLGPTLEGLVGKRCHALNDCDAGTLGEHVYGSARGARTAVGLFMGTGLGGGIVHEGKLLSGDNRQAAEIGHMVVAKDGRRCGCGRRGCLEAYASKRAIARRLARQVDVKGRECWLSERVHGGWSRLKSSQLAKAYDKGDPVVIRTVDEAMEFLGLGVGNLITLLGPSVVVLGGGVVTALGHVVIGHVRSAARGASWPPSSWEDTRIELGELGDDAVALGAVAYARQQVERAALG